ncbi:MAG: TlpA disulfide reductase family protein [Acidobacteriota bacterium]
MISPRRAGAFFASALFLLLAVAPGSAAAPGAAARLSGELDVRGLQALLAEQKGRVVLVNFWATWCVPCREEFPDLIRLQKDLGPRGLTIIGISTDFAGQAAAVEAFLSETRPNFRNYRKKAGGDDGAFIDTIDESWGGELPFSVLFAADGRKLRVLSGKRSYAQYRGEIAKALGRP